jgi:hypothetical protein
VLGLFCVKAMSLVSIHVKVLEIAYVTDGMRRSLLQSKLEELKFFCDLSFGKARDSRGRLNRVAFFSSRDSLFAFIVATSD